MQLHDILLLRTAAILPEAISAGGLTPTTDTSLLLTTYRGGSHLPADISKTALPASAASAAKTAAGKTAAASKGRSSAASAS